MAEKISVMSPDMAKKKTILKKDLNKARKQDEL